MDESPRLAQKLYDHCLGPGNPVGKLVSTGHLPPNWASQYLSLVEKAASTWHHSDAVPRKVAAAVHYASMHVCYYYEVWKGLNVKSVCETDDALKRVRLQSELFLCPPQLGACDVTREREDTNA